MSELRVAAVCLVVGLVLGVGLVVFVHPAHLGSVARCARGLAGLPGRLVSAADVAVGACRHLAGSAVGAALRALGALAVLLAAFVSGSHAMVIHAFSQINAFLGAWAASGAARVNGWASALFHGLPVYAASAGIVAGLHRSLGSMAAGLVDAVRALVGRAVRAVQAVGGVVAALLAGLCRSLSSWASSLSQLFVSATESGLHVVRALVTPVWSGLSAVVGAIARSGSWLCSSASSWVTVISG